jgi:predicted anti-sigma-YlaC factor YlaD
MFRCARFAVLAWVAVGALGCTGLAVGAIGNSLGKGGGTYAQDDDPDLIAAAIPFGLKTVESLLDAEPEHRGLLLAATRGFTQYAYAFTQAEADYIEEADFRRAAHMRRRAKRLYKRAIAYGLRGMDAEYEDFLKRLRTSPKELLDEVVDEHEDEDVGLLYWTAISWAAAVALDKEDAALAAELDLVELLMNTGFRMEPSHGAGAFHDFFMVWHGGRPPAGGGSIERAEHHLKESLKVSGAQRVAPLVSFAEVVVIKQQNRARFTELLNRALAFDADTVPRHRLANLVAQKRARWLLAQADDLFLE